MAAFLHEHEFLVGISIDGPREVHDTFRLTRGGRGSFDQVMRGLVTSRSVSPEGYGRFLIEVFEEWVRRDVAEVYVQMFDATLANFPGEQPGMCVHCETCGSALAMEHNGAFTPATTSSSPATSSATSPSIT